MAKAAQRTSLCIASVASVAAAAPADGDWLARASTRMPSISVAASAVITAAMAGTIQAARRQKALSRPAASACAAKRARE